MIFPHSGSIRKQDAYGSGLFCAPRGKRRHPGIDILTTLGDEIVSPFTGLVSKVGYTYSDDPSFRYIDVMTIDFVARIMYVSPECAKGDRVELGDRIGTALDLTLRYGPDSSRSSAISNHIHFGLRLRWGASIVGGRSGHVMKDDGDSDNWVWINPTVILSCKGG